MSVKIVVSVTEIADMSSKDRYVIEGVGKSVSKITYYFHRATIQIQQTSFVSFNRE